MFLRGRGGAASALLALALSAGFCAPRLDAQAVAIAEVAGRVTDPSGAPVSGAQVTITETEKQQVRNVVSDDQGRYALPNLPVGPYKLEVQASGFKTYVQSGILLQVGNNVEINAVLQIGSVNESIEVTASAAMVETRENAVAQVIDEKRIVDLPLNGRQPTQLIVLSGAAVNAPGGGMTGSKNYASSTTISVAGGQANGVNYLLDGGDHNDNATNVNLPIPFPDALQEFSVQTSSLPARYGLHPGAVVNAVTKSGTNTMHGSLFEFLRNGDVNARNTFAPRHDTLKRNQFGGTFGDKIIRDKLFFFGGFQATRQRTDPPQSVAYVATPSTLNGDFSSIDGSGCISGGKAKQLVDPYTKVPFANNQIPVSRFNQQALNLLKYVPMSNDPCGKITYGIPSTGDENQGIGRVDWVQNSKHSLFGRYFITDYQNPPVFDGKNLLTTTAAGSDERVQSLTIGDTYSISPTAINSFHATASRRRINRGPADNLINGSDLGVNILSPDKNFLQATVSSYFNVGC
ncbi:MAG TPA: carboxypeptidase-like regulatory domain-containing protein, partial [Bryobacteraceae bacterium]|nr:carboxypeptidase-like regulatory domain-containing protein [Bryobacteraceae bacterium]